MLCYSQPNCNIYIKGIDSTNYEVCERVLEAGSKYYQFKKEYHQILDSALVVFPKFSYAYREKAAPYVKSGNFIEWKQLIDKAVKYDRNIYLDVRASLRYKFFADYRGAIKDIDSLDRETEYDIGHTSNGTYHLNVVKALCYKALNNNKKAINILTKQIVKLEEEDFIGPYDYIHLGVLYFEEGEYKKAVEALKKQEKVNDISENRYYLGKCYLALNDIKNTIKSLEIAKNLFYQDRRMLDPYSTLFDQVFLKEIEDEINKLKN